MINKIIALMTIPVIAGVLPSRGFFLISFKAKIPKTIERIGAKNIRGGKTKTKEKIGPKT